MSTQKSMDRLEKFLFVALFVMGAICILAIFVIGSQGLRVQLEDDIESSRFVQTDVTLSVGFQSETNGKFQVDPTPWDYHLALQPCDMLTFIANSKRAPGFFTIMVLFPEEELPHIRPLTTKSWDHYWLWGVLREPYRRGQIIARPIEEPVTVILLWSTVAIGTDVQERALELSANGQREFKQTDFVARVANTVGLVYEVTVENTDTWDPDICP